MAKKRDPYAEQAASQSVLKFGPEESALAALLRDAEERFGTANRQAKSARQYTVAAVDAATPQLQQAYQAAGQAVSPAFTSGGGVEASALQARLAESQAQAAQQLQARRVGAYEGEGAARSQALRDLASDRGKVLQRLQDLQQEKGAFTTSTIADLVGADRKAEADAAELQSRLDQQERNSIRSSGIDPDTGQPIPGGKLDQKAKAKAKSKSRATPAQQQRASRAIGQGLASLKLLDPDKDPKNWGPLGDLLQRGQKSQTLKDEFGNERVSPKGVPLSTPEVKPIDTVFARAALQMYYRGFIDDKVVRQLHQLGYSVRDLPDIITRFQRRQARGGDRITRPGNTPGANGQSRPT